MQLNGGYANGMPYINHAQTRGSPTSYDDLAFSARRAFSPSEQTASNFTNYAPYPPERAGSSQSYVGLPELPQPPYHTLRPSPDPSSHRILYSSAVGVNDRPSFPSLRPHSRSHCPDRERLTSLSPPHSSPSMNPLCYRDAGPFLRDEFQIPKGVEVNLYALPDPKNNDERPAYTLHDLAMLAIYGYPRHKASLQEIRAAIQQRYPFFQGSNQKKFCVRLLSLPLSMWLTAAVGVDTPSTILPFHLCEASPSPNRAWSWRVLDSRCRPRIRD